MLQEITIKNFKSIENDTIKLGRVNVFIGENGCGKSNILEAVAFASTLENGKIELKNLIQKGVRLAKPSLMRNSFRKITGKNNISIDLFFAFPQSEKLLLNLIPNTNDKNDIFANWIDEDIITNIQKLSSLYQNMSNIQNEEELLELLKTIVEVSEKTTPNNDKIGYESLEILKVFKSVLSINNQQDNKAYFLDNFKLFFPPFLIYGINTPALRGFTNESNEEPIGIYGENLDVFIANLEKEELEILKKYTYLIEWLDTFKIDKNDKLGLQGYKLNRSDSLLYFTDKFMTTKNNVFSAENTNEGILHILFYLSVMISKKTPKFFAIDNIESCLNPHLCTHLMKEICTLAKEQDKQLLITTHNPAILDGLNLNDDEIRLFEVSRNRAGHTVTRRIEVKPEHEQQEGRRLKLSELWTRGYLGAVSENF